MNSDKLHRHFNSTPTVLDDLHSKIQEAFVKKISNRQSARQHIISLSK